MKIEEFGGFDDPFSQKFYAQTLSQIQSAYGKKIELVFRHFPLDFQQYSQVTAQASECSREQGKFREYHNLLFENRDFSDKALQEYAVKLGLDADKFASCLSSGAEKEKVSKDFADGSARGVSGTPTFFLSGPKGNEKVVGAQEYGVFKQAIETVLNGQPADKSKPSPEAADQQAEPRIGVGTRVTITTYFGFQDPYSAKFVNDTMDIILTPSFYYKEAAFEMRNFPLSFHENGENTALAGECAAAQKGYFDQYARMLFKNQDKLSIQDLKNYAAQVGMDAAKFNSCLDSKEYLREVMDDKRAGEADSVTGTPTFIIKGPKGTERVVGAQALSAYTAAIQKVLGIEAPKEEPPAPPQTSKPAPEDDVKKTAQEQVKCVFEGSSAAQECYSEYGKCSGSPSCAVDVKGPAGTAIIWKSTCGGYAYTTIDGSNESAKFTCQPKQETGAVQTEPVSAKTCVEGETRAYTCTSNKKVQWCSCIGNSWKCIEAPEKQCGIELNDACSGCIEGGQCFPIGTRLSQKGAASYCGITSSAQSISYSIEVQKKDGTACQNSYECESNTCSGGVCVNIQKQLNEQRNILQQILDWLSSIFGFKAK